MEVRGIRNNNPGNLNYVGQAGTHLEKGVHPRFAVFATPEAGLMALRGQLLRYNQRDGLDTAKGIISKWAPPTENDTPATLKAWSMPSASHRTRSSVPSRRSS